MQVKTNVYLSELDIRAIIKKHLEKTGFKVVGELEIMLKNKNEIRKGMNKIDTIGISAEVEKQFKNRISLPKND
jgi:hypothetical protein